MTDDRITAPATDSWPEALSGFAHEGLLGRGGMGAVHLVRSRLTGEPYAAKISTLPAAGEQRQFLAELALWIDLPQHPNLAACRFFRSFGSSIAIFSEFVPGGSLYDAIHRDSPLDLPRILDIAIQSAHGLHMLHESALAHGDVKPSNLLLTDEGSVKIGDFGLARGRHQPFAGGSAFTLQYASPEQERGEVSRATDIWSWGLTVLAMFAGGAVWATGSAARIALQTQVRRNRQGDKDIVALPDAIASLLHRCFELDPAKRWNTTFEIEHALRQIAFASTGLPYGRLLQPAPQVVTVERVRQADIGLRWPAPRPWLEWAWEQQASGQAQQSPPSDTGTTRVSQALNDLIAFEEVQAVLDQLIGTRPELGAHLGSVLVFRASILGSLEQHKAALDAYAKAADCYQALEAHGDKRARRALAPLLVNRAWSMRHLNAPVEALQALQAAHDMFVANGDVEGQVTALTAIAGIRSDLADGDGALEVILHALSLVQTDVALPWERVAGFAKALASLGMLAYRWGRVEYAVQGLQSAADNFAGLLRLAWTQHDLEQQAATSPSLSESVIRMAYEENRPQEAVILEYWALVTTMLITVLNAAGRYDGADSVASSVIEALEPRLERQQSPRDLVGLAAAYLSWSQTDVLRGRSLQGQAPAAAQQLLITGLAKAERAADLFRELVFVHGRERLAGELGGAYANIASMLAHGGRSAQGLQKLQDAVRLIEGFQQSFPGREATHALCRILVNGGLMELHNRRPASAPGWFDRAVAYYDDLAQEGVADIAADRACALYSRGYTYLLLDDVRRTFADLHEAVPVIQREARRTQRADLVQQLEQIRLQFGDRYWEGQRA